METGTTPKQHNVRPWDEKDIEKMWVPIYTGNIEELLQAAGTILLTFEAGDGFVAWGGEPEEVREVAKKISSGQQDKELAYLYRGGPLLVWSSVEAFINSVLYDWCI